MAGGYALQEFHTLFLVGADEDEHGDDDLLDFFLAVAPLAYHFLDREEMGNSRHAEFLGGFLFVVHSYVEGIPMRFFFGFHLMIPL